MSIFKKNIFRGTVPLKGKLAMLYSQHAVTLRPHGVKWGHSLQAKDCRFLAAETRVEENLYKILKTICEANSWSEVNLQPNINCNVAKQENLKK